MDARMDPGYKTLTMLDVNFSGFTVVHCMNNSL